MALTVTVTPGKQFAATEKVTIPKLNQLGQPTFAVTGTMGTGEITDDSVTAAKLVPGAVYYADSVSFSNGDYDLDFSPNVSLADGLLVAFKANANGVPNVTTGIRLQLDGGAAKKLFKNKTESITPGDIVTNQIVEARYDTAGDGGAGAWQMTSQPSNLPDYYAATVGGTGDVITLTITPPASYPIAFTDLNGKRIRFKATADNTTAVTVNVTIGGGAALGAKNLRKNFDRPLVAGDIKKYQYVDIVYESNATLSTDAFQLLSAIGNPLADSAVVADARNLVGKNNTGTPNSIFDVTADEVVLRNSANLNYSAKTVNVSINMGATAGNPNALDTGAEAPDTWYYVWLIYNGTTVAGLFSTSATAPTLPTGYTYKALVGQVRNGATSNFFTTLIYGRNQYQATQDIAATITGVTAYTVLSGTPATDFAKAVPPTAKTATILIGRTSNNNFLAAVSADGTGLGEQVAYPQALATTFNGMNGVATLEAPLLTSQLFYWKVDSTSAAGYKMQTTGFTF